MKRAVRSVSKLGYQKAAKPLMFRQKPDKVHEGMIRMARGVQRIPLVRDVPKLWAYKNDAYLAQSILGISFKNPIGLSAGLDKNADTVGVMQAIGFGFMTVGSVTAEPCEGNPKPWFHRLPKSKSLVVHVGLANRGVELVAKRIARYPSKLYKNFVLSVSCAKTNSQKAASDVEAIKDYCHSLSVMDEEPNVRLLEINISCPNTYGGEPFTTPKRLDALLAAVDNLHLKKPVFIKMPLSLDWPEFEPLVQVADRHDVQGLSIGNLLKNRAKAQLNEELPDTIKGSLSGLPTKDISTELIRKTYVAYANRFVIIGIGGVFSAEDAYEKIKAGASLVALVTGVIFEGPQLVGDINHGLVRLLKEDGYKNITDAIGVDTH